MKQLFEVGEVVIADFKYYPQNNGEYTILEVLTQEQVKAEFPKFNILSDVYYRLEGLAIIGPKNGDICDAAGQPALRKKHQPSSQSFKDMMTTLKSPQKVEWE